MNNTKYHLGDWLIEEYDRSRHTIIDVDQSYDQPVYTLLELYKGEMVERTVAEDGLDHGFTVVASSPLAGISPDEAMDMFSDSDEFGPGEIERINGMSMVDGIHAMADGDFATFEDLWDAVQEAKDDKFVRPDQPFEFDDEGESE
ncbi:hypothetical protein [Haloarcula sp. CGMCC 1.6347]|uniref:hypothetical protein n=1 Tax=Haloarcula sp. CGMCC 1.6347 TaxID=3111455 RepID=UPI00300E9A6C